MLREQYRVIARLLEEGPQVLATGGGAYMNADTRAAIAEKGLSVWLKAEFDVLMKRVKRRSTADRPMLQGDPAQRIRDLMDERYPVYAEADVTVMSRDVAHETIVNEIIAALAGRIGDPTQAIGRGRRMMTAVQRATEPITVNVGLGERAYDIVIGRGVAGIARQRASPR